MKIVIEQEDPEGPVTFDAVYQLPPAQVTVYLADGHRVSFKAQTQSVVDLSGDLVQERPERFSPGAVGRVLRRDTGTFKITFDHVEDVVFDTAPEE